VTIEADGDLAEIIRRARFVTRRRSGKRHRVFTILAVDSHRPSPSSAAARESRTEALARFAQPRRTTSQQPTARFADLLSHPFETLEAIRQAMLSYAASWQADVLDGNVRELSSEELAQCRRDHELFRQEEERFAAGVAALAADERLRRAFDAMNRVFQRTAGGRYDSWHLFQIVFIVSQLPALACREDVVEGEWPAGTRREWPDALEWADVLWFPTGGGKTEAYLGLIACAALFDRLRGKRFGVTAWLRFPLRMLSVQQLQRAAVVLWEAEQERLRLQGDASSNSDKISLGYFVGGTSTPNQLRSRSSTRCSTRGIRSASRACVWSPTFRSRSAPPGTLGLRATRPAAC
jgi:hypothetical protein